MGWHPPDVTEVWLQQVSLWYRVLPQRTSTCLPRDRQLLARYVAFPCVPASPVTKLKALPSIWEQAECFSIMKSAISKYLQVCSNTSLSLCSLIIIASFSHPAAKFVPQQHIQLGRQHLWAAQSTPMSAGTQFPSLIRQAEQWLSAIPLHLMQNILNSPKISNTMHFK